MHNQTEAPLFILDDNGQYRDRDNKLLRIKVKGDDYIYPKNGEQAELIAKLDLGVALNVGTGDAGTGKTFLMFAHTLAKELERREKYGKKAHGDKRKFFLVKPLLAMDEKIGALPGDLPEKILPMYQPFMDVLHYFFGDNLGEVKPVLGRYLLNCGDIEFEIAPLAFIRGRNIRNAYMFLDEAQNATERQIDAFQTRAAENTQVFIMGDVQQCDLPKGENSGLADYLDILKYAPKATGPEDDFVMVELLKSERSALVQRYLLARRARNAAREEAKKAAQQG